jgi:glycosyltransferase involved in cell wall biosynthesis
MSEYSKQKLIKSGLKKELVHVIPYGINLPADFEKVRSNKYIKCIAAGRMVSKKAPLLLLESFRLALKKNDLLKLDFVGTGVLYNKALQYVKDFKLEDKVKLHGSLPHDAVINMMKDADILLQHSITCPDTGDEEGLPVSILEAMAHCLPVVSTFHAGIPEAVINNKSGFLVKEGDINAMAQAILNLAGNESLRISMGKVGRSIVEKNFTWDIEKSSLLKLFNKEKTLSNS